MTPNDAVTPADLQARVSEERMIGLVRNRTGCTTEQAVDALQGLLGLIFPPASKAQA